MVESPPPLSASRRTVAAYVAVLKLARERGYVVTRLKMAKFLYLTDLAAVRESEDPVSGVEWRWLHHGPFNNSLQFLENELVERRVVQRDPYYQGFQIRLVGELPGYDMPTEDMAILEKTLTELGGLAAATLKDLSYQTPPMEDALQRERGVVLDLSLARPRPKLAKLARRMSAVLRQLPEQENDPGIGQELEREMAELAEGRRRANGMLLDDDQ
ncbi:type II toxin-antitoxin system antitoxin SocA domain-containing protein [Micromonospora sp. LOL_015]|uniref:type II toxin-antitoxin system antitoxin SocA domain-containing protein n=1 Tax=Micromonospora sp. LOL_015 TaxID=3345416 RepID=UPI003A85C259